MYRRVSGGLWRCKSSPPPGLCSMPLRERWGFMGHRRMFKVELYGRVRRAVLVEGRSQRAVALEFGVSRDSVRKMLRFSVSPGYQRQQPVKRPRLGPWTGVIDAILEEDRQRPAKQRHTAKRILDRLREEHGFSGGYTIVKDYVRTATLRGREMFVPLTHPAGEAQVDFGEALAVIGGVERKAHYLVMDLPHSDDLLRGGVSGRDDRGVSGRPRKSLRLLRRGAHAHSVRQHQDRGGEDPGRHRAAAGREPSPSCRAIISLPTSSGGRRRATTRARWKGWSGTRGGTSWCRSRPAPNLRGDSCSDSSCTRHAAHRARS